MNKHVWILVLVFFLAFGLFADEQPTVFERFDNALGAYGIFEFEAGHVLGGLSWQGWLGRIGIQAAAGGMVSNGQGYNYNALVVLQYCLYAADFNPWFSGALYTNLMLGHSAKGTSGSSWDPKMHLGIGIGIETVFLEHLAPSLEFKYIASWPLSVGFGMGLNLRYRF